MHWYEEEVSLLEKRIRNGEIAQNVNLFYGSSSFRLWENLASDLAPYPVANVAFGGSTLEACVYFFERLVLPCRPRSLVFYAGDNDIGDGVYHSDIMGYFESLLAKRARYLSHIPFTFVSVKPSPARHNQLHRIRLLNAYVRDRLEALPGTFYLDVHSRMYTPEGMPDAALYGEDGLHMSPRGYALWQETFLGNADNIFVR